MKRHFIAWMSGLLFLLPLCAVHSIYRLTNFLCMARAEPAYQHLWLARIYVWCGISLSLGFVWIALLIIVVRRGRLEA
jgi:hypothetical protein